MLIAAAVRLLMFSQRAGVSIAFAAERLRTGVRLLQQKNNPGKIQTTTKMLEH